MRISCSVTAVAFGLDALIAAAFFSSLPWLGLGCLAIACGVFDGLRVREPFVANPPDQLD